MESLEEFYKWKTGGIPEEVKKDIGHFNMFKVKPIEEGKPRTIPYRRRDFYKIMLIKGNSRVHYADQVVEIKKQALSFSNPQIPYKWEHLDRVRDGVFCIFSSKFFEKFADFQHYEVFQPTGQHVFELTDSQVRDVAEIFAGLESDFSGDYKYKFDLIRNKIIELVHYGIKLEPSETVDAHQINASHRISLMFMDLLERQFPIDEVHQSVKYRSPSEFADQLNVHVNHLNRAIKETTQQTTTEIITKRILEESKTLLRQTMWNVSEISYALGFKEATHFNNFFKKHVELSPTVFRKG